MAMIELAGEALGVTARALIWLVSDVLGELLIRGTGHVVHRRLFRQEPSEMQEWLYGILVWMAVVLVLLACYA